MGGFGGDWGIGLSAPSVRFSATSPVNGGGVGSSSPAERGRWRGAPEGALQSVSENDG